MTEPGISLEAAIELFVVFVLGVLLGSFGGAAAYRIPREIPLGWRSKSRSECPHCGSPIPWYRNIPIGSFLFQRGQAMCCGKPLRWQYLASELLMPIFFVATFWIWRISHANDIWANPSIWIHVAVQLYFVFALVVTTLVDVEFRIIPDRFSIGGWVVAMSAALATGTPHWGDALLGSALGFGIFLAMALFYEKVRKIEGLGMGDVKMMAWLGAWLGAWAVPQLVLIASLSAMIVGLVSMRTSGEGMRTALPFGPFLALGAWAVWVLNNLNINLFFVPLE